MSQMRIWVDADACPKLIKEILFRAAKRTKIEVLLVANHSFQIPASPFIKRILVTAGFDKTDNYIIQNMRKNDLIITADIPLANLVIENEGIALNPRGQLYTKDNIKEYLLMRNIKEELRSGIGIASGGPAQFSQREIRQFASCLDKILVLYTNS